MSERHTYDVTIVDYVVFRDTCLEMLRIINDRLKVLKPEEDENDHYSLSISSKINDLSIKVDSFNRLEEFMHQFESSNMTMLRVELHTQIRRGKPGSYSYLSDSNRIKYSFLMELEYGKLNTWTDFSEDLSKTDVPLQLSLLMKKFKDRYRPASVFNPRRYFYRSRIVMSSGILVPVIGVDAGRLMHLGSYNPAPLLASLAIIQVAWFAISASLLPGNNGIDMNMDCLKRIPDATKSQ